MEGIYDKWQLNDKDEDLGNGERYQFTKSELLDFAKYYYDKQLILSSVSVTERKSCHVCGTTEYYITDDGHKACKKHRCYLISGKN
tara:strand:- start:2862 stop:3119 length:258 start_codon:yes stop_codon:yes gene_type:complete